MLQDDGGVIRSGMPVHMSPVQIPLSATGARKVQPLPFPGKAIDGHYGR